MKVSLYLKLILFACLMMHMLTANGQRIEVESLREETGTTDNSKWPKDYNGLSTAKVTVVSDIPNLLFDGNIVGDIEKLPQGYNVYITAGTKRINVKCSGLASEMVNFDEYLSGRIKSGNNYVLTLKVLEPLDENDISVLRKLSDDGDPVAMNQLGVRLQMGRGVERDMDEAVSLYFRAASKGNPDAQCNVGLCYLHGAGVEKDYKKAFEYLLKSANNGNIQAQRMVGSCYMKGIGTERDMSKGMNWCYKAAQSNDGEAQYNLGWCYYKGIGVEKNIPLAINWFKRSSDRNDTEASFMLGECYSEGDGVEKNPENAFRYYLKAAEMGHKYAQYRLSVCYSEGIGTKRDKKAAEMWLDRSGVPKGATLLEH